jgi:hypothetical protein
MGSDVERLLLYVRFRRAAMVAPSDTLPTRNEDYGTKEYWYVLTCQFCSLSHCFFLGISGTRDTHSESPKEV